MNVRPRKHDLTHARIVEEAARALRRDGFDGVRVADVMKAAGLTHGGFYAHFPDREGLIAEAVAHAVHDSAAALEAAMAQREAKGASRFRALVEAYLAPAHRDGIETGCPVAALGTEMPRQPDRVRAATRHAVSVLQERVRKRLPAGVDPGQAPLICAALVGALQIARGLESSARARTFLARCQAALLRQYDPDG